MVILPSVVQWGACRGHILQQEDSLCHFTSAQIPQGSICDSVARVEAETCFRSIAGLRHKVICCCYLEPRPVSVYEGVPGSGHPPVQVGGLSLFPFPDLGPGCGVSDIDLGATYYVSLPVFWHMLS